MFLFFFAGLELVEQRVARRSLVRGTAGWAISLAIGLVVGLALHEAGLDAEGWLLGVALSTTALGTLVPILADAGLLPTPLGSAVLGTGVAGEFWPIVVDLDLPHRRLRRGSETCSSSSSARRAARGRRLRSARARRASSASSSRPCTRRARLPFASPSSSSPALVFLAIEVGFDFVLGAFAGGLVVGLALNSPEAAPVRMRLEGIGFGFLIPIYFVVTGMNFDLDSLLTPTGLGLAALFLGLFSSSAAPRCSGSASWGRGAR